MRADVVTLSADVSGRIVSLAVQDNQHVNKGQALLEIDPARYTLAVEHAKRAVEVAKASLGQAQAAIIASEALLKQRQSEEQRRRTLKDRSAISGEEWRRPTPMYRWPRPTCCVTRPIWCWPRPTCNWPLRP